MQPAAAKQQTIKYRAADGRLPTAISGLQHQGGLRPPTIPPLHNYKEGGLRPPANTLLKPSHNHKSLLPEGGLWPPTDHIFRWSASRVKAASGRPSTATSTPASDKTCFHSFVLGQTPVTLQFDQACPKMPKEPNHAEVFSAIAETSTPIAPNERAMLPLQPQRVPT